MLQSGNDGSCTATWGVAATITDSSEYNLGFTVIQILCFLLSHSKDVSFYLYIPSFSWLFTILTRTILNFFISQWVTLCPKPWRKVMTLLKNLVGFVDGIYERFLRMLSEIDFNYVLWFNNIMGTAFKDQRVVVKGNVALMILINIVQFGDHY